jgi:hypothetical protein
MPLANKCSSITGFLENFPQKDFIRTDPDIVDPSVGSRIPDQTIPEGKAACQQGRTGGCTVRCGHIKIGAEDSLFSYPVDVGSVNCIFAITGYIPISQIIGKNDQYIGLPGGIRNPFATHSCKQENQKKERIGAWMD